ncbi:MAG: Uma2 family endonuclease [Caldilineaceae bacterium]|nr:Uma2 family endonuclease [Caldilineaceae bacterium]
MESTEMAPDAPQSQTDQPQPNRSTPTEAVSPNPTQDTSWAPDNGRCVTLEEYWEKWYENPYPDLDVSYEWNNGILEAKPPSNAPQIRLYNWFLFLLHRYLETFDHASLINLETGFVLKIEDDSDPKGERIQVRKPDIGVILNTNPVSWGALDQRHFDGVCDMVVESVSDSTMEEVLRDTEEKKNDYALGGVKEYYILDPEGEHMRFYALTSEGTYKEIPPDANGVIRSNVLAGLQFRLDDLHRRPGLVELALDDVYSGYVIPELRAAITRAETATEARKRAEEQAETASAARERAEAQAVTPSAARERAEEKAATEAAARQQAEEKVKALEAELARLRRKSS